MAAATDALGQAASYQYQEHLLVQESFKNGLSFYFEYAGSGPAARCVHTWGDEGIYDHRLVYDVVARRMVVTPRKRQSHLPCSGWARAPRWGAIPPPGTVTVLVGELLAATAMSLCLCVSFVPD